MHFQALVYQEKNSKFIYDGFVKRTVSNINPYLSSGENVVVNKLSSPISYFPKMSLGNMPKDDGNFILSKEKQQ